MPGVVAVNSTWIEALDPGSGRLYFIDLNTQESAWEAPTLFLDRKQLVVSQQALASELAECEAAGEDEAKFLARVRQRFPPPREPPPAAASKQQVAALEKENASLREQLTALKAQLAARPAADGPPPPAAARKASAVPASPSRPSWVRGASTVAVQDPPPPPAWALQLSKSRRSCLSSSPSVGSPGAPPPLPPGGAPPLPPRHFPSSGSGVGQSFAGSI